MFLSILGQQGGIIGGVGQAMAITFPLTEAGEIKNKILSEKITTTIKLNEAKAKKDFDQLKKLEEKLASIPQLPSSRDDLIWSILIASFTIILLINGKFSLIEKFCIILVSSFTLITILNLFALQSHGSWAIKMDEIVHGLSFSFPEAINGYFLYNCLLSTWSFYFRKIRIATSRRGNDPNTLFHVSACFWRMGSNDFPHWCCSRFVFNIFCSARRSE